MPIKRIVFILSFVSAFGFSQNSKNIYLKNKKTNETIPYATIFNLSYKRGAVTNIDGNAILKYNSENDTLKISCVGFEKKWIQIKDIPNSGIVFLSLQNKVLNDITITAQQNQKEIAKLLIKIVKENKKHTKIETTKSNLITFSTVNGLPLELQESIGNAKVSNNGLSDYQIKLGRFGQNKSFNFYTLTFLQFANKFQPFSQSNSFVPKIITELSRKEILKKFKLKHIKNLYQNSELSQINFSSKTKTEFSGELIFNSKTLKIKEIKLHIKNPKENLFYSIIQDKKVKTKNLSCNFLYDDVENRLRSINFDYELDYETPKKYQIKTNSIISFEDYNTPYSNSIYTEKKDFDGEYQQIIFNSFDDKFWKENFVYSESENTKKNYNYFKENGYVANYNKYTNDNLFDFLNFRIINWDTTRIRIKELGFESRNYKISKEDMDYTTNDLYNFEVNYYGNEYIYENGDTNFIFLVKIDLKNSYYFLEYNFQTEVAMNIFFDIFQKNKGKINSMASLQKIYEETKKEASEFFFNTEKGNNEKVIVKQNEIISEELNIDNLKLLSRRAFITKDHLNKIPNFYNVGSAYLKIKKYKKGIYYLNKSYNLFLSNRKVSYIDVNDVKSNYYTKKEKEFIKNLMYDRGVTYIKLKEIENACKDLNFASEIGDEEAETLLIKYCK